MLTATCDPERDWAAAESQNMVAAQLAALTGAVAAAAAAAVGAPGSAPAGPAGPAPWRDGTISASEILVLDGSDWQVDGSGRTYSANCTGVRPAPGPLRAATSVRLLLLAGCRPHSETLLRGLHRWPTDSVATRCLSTGWAQPRFRWRLRHLRGGCQLHSPRSQPARLV